jgi:ABC-type branched-subunit amino acid transport system substrate-binding protein
MVGVIVTFRYPGDFSAAKVQAIANNARQKFVGMPGLRSKTFTLDANAKEAVNFYVWESREAAETFFTPQLTEAVTGLYGVRPDVRYVEIAALVDNANAPTGVRV